MPPTDRETGQIPRTLLLMAFATLVLGSAVIGVVRTDVDLGPEVGDLVAFDPGREPLAESNGRLIAMRDNRAPCVLDLATLRRLGGSLMVESRAVSPDRIYRTHWAGPHTSEGATDCGTDAELTLSAKDLTALAMAALPQKDDNTSALRLR